MANATQTKEPAKAGGRLSLKQAVGQALRYFHEVYPDLAHARVMLEEVEETEDGRFFLITIGYDLENRNLPAPGKFPGLLGPPWAVERKYKRLSIEADTGKVVSMKIRTVP